MTCPREEALLLYVENLETECRSHVETCPACRGAVKELEKTIRELRSAVPVGSNPTAERLLRVRPAVQPAGPRRIFFAAAAVILVATGLGLFYADPKKPSKAQPLSSVPAQLPLQPEPRLHPAAALAREAKIEVHVHIPGDPIPPEERILRGICPSRQEYPHSRTWGSSVPPEGQDWGLPSERITKSRMAALDAEAVEFVMFDLEHWGMHSIPTIKRTAPKMKTFFGWVKEANPALKVLRYSAPPHNMGPAAAKAGPGSPEYTSVQKLNDLMVSEGMVDLLDALVVSGYNAWPSTEDWKIALRENYKEGRRIGGGKPLYAILNGRYHANHPNRNVGQPQELFKFQLDSVKELGFDGLIIWWNNTGSPVTWAQLQDIGWWKAFEEFLGEHTIKCDAFGGPGPVATDSDGDGLPDGWEQEHFGGLSQTTGGDPDADSYSNLQEFQAGTDPMDPASTPAALPSSGGGGGGGGGSCGLLGIEALIGVGLFAFFRRRRPLL